MVASDKCYGSLATRLWGGSLSSMIQLSPPLGWPQQSMGEVTMHNDSVTACS